MERIITMSTKELDRADVLSKLKQKALSQTQAADVLGISCRQVGRLYKGYRGNCKTPLPAKNRWFWVSLPGSPSDPNSAAKDILERVGLGGGAAKWLKSAVLRRKGSFAIPSLASEKNFSEAGSSTNWILLYIQKILDYHGHFCKVRQDFAEQIFTQEGKNAD